MKSISQAKIKEEFFEDVMADWYYLDEEHKAIQWKDHFDTYEDYMAWWSQPHTRQLFHDSIGDKVSVSTIFLGLDHAFYMESGNKDAPVLFETMVFGGPNHGDMERYASYEDAKRGHEEIVKKQPSGISRADFERGADLIRKLMDD